MTEDLKNIIIAFEKFGMVNFGEFTVKSGIKTPVYVDMRILISHPEVMKLVAKAYSPLLKKLQYDRLGAIPYAALPIAEAISLERNEPWVFYRKEAKNYGLKKMVEGEFKPGETIVIVDDLVTRGDSKLDAVAPFENAGFVIKDFVVLMSYDLGADRMLAAKGYNLHYAFTMRDVIETLLEIGRINNATFDAVAAFLKNNQM